MITQLYDKHEGPQLRGSGADLPPPRHDTLLREYTMVCWQRAIYNVYGSEHPSDGVLLLLRYAKTPDGWVKPPVFWVEADTGPQLAAYDLPLRFVPRFGIKVAVGPVEACEYSGVSDPLDPRWTAVTAPFAAVAGCPVGLSGSRSVGLSGPCSDLDLVVYGGSPAQAWERLRDMTAPMAYEDHFLLSRALRRFRQVASGVVDRLPIRNAFNAVFRGHDGRLKLDMAYGASPSPVALGDLPRSRRRQPNVWSLVITDVQGRYYSPGFVLGVAHGVEYRVWIRDRSLRYVLSGDEVVVRGRSADACGSLDVCAEEVLEVKLGR